MTAKNTINIAIMVLMAIFVSLSGQDKNSDTIIEIFENFDSDPYWEGSNNRVECDDCPTIKQDFGWKLTNFTGSGPGEIGGIIWRSTTPAYYAMPLGPYSFKDKLSVSGKIAVKATEKEGFGFYIGFFNSERQGWRVWSSCGFRIGEVRSGRARFFLDYKTGHAAGAILNPDLELPADGSVHSWELIYDPDATIKDSWPDPRLPMFLDSSRSLHEDEVFERAKKIDPTITKEKLDEILFKARDMGLVDDWYRKGLYHVWSIEKEAKHMKGKISFRFDDNPAVSYFLLPGHRDTPSDIDRFGIYNMQIYNGKMEFYVSDLVVNEKKIDLSKDPYWKGFNNNTSWIQNDFHARQNFGYSQTNWAGEKPGEIGGRFWGTEVIDPLHAFYADDIGKLTLNDPISFSGWINFPEGAVDGRMLLGYFNRDVRLEDIKGEYKGNPPHQFLGLEVMDQTRVGYNFTAVCSPRQNISTEQRGPVYIPDRLKRPFSFKYDPDAGEAGQITVSLGKDTFSVNLTPEQREAGASFDRFGLLNPRKGGKYVDVYVDDLTYVARYPENYKPQNFEQKTVKVPYPNLGRKY
jgi:hypothetical protein